MINIRKRGNVYQYCFEAGKVNGKRKQITKSGFNTKNEAYTAGQSAFLTGCYTGMRTGEVFALTWDDIDLDNRIININKTVYAKEKAKSEYEKYKVIQDNNYVSDFDRLLNKTKQIQNK